MHKTYSAIYVINIVFQSIFTLFMYIGSSLLLAWLLVDKLGLPSWIYAVTTTVGILIGFFSMIKFILTAMNALDHIEKSNKTKRRNNNQNEKK